MTTNPNPPWECGPGVDLDTLPRDTNPRGPDGKSCPAEWAGTLDAAGLPWKCTMPPDHEPEPHRAGNGREIVAEWPSVKPLGWPRLACDRQEEHPAHGWPSEMPARTAWFWCEAGGGRATGAQDTIDEGAQR